MFFAIEINQVDMVLHHCLLYLGVPNYPWEIVGMDCVTDLPKSSKINFTAGLILVCHLTNMAHFVPCHIEIIAEETYFFDNFTNFTVFLKSLYLAGIPDSLVHFGNHL